MQEKHDEKLVIIILVVSLLVSGIISAIVYRSIFNDDVLLSTEQTSEQPNEPIESELSDKEILEDILNQLEQIEKIETEETKHTHKFKFLESIQATCGINGSLIYECECGEKHKENTPALEHIYSLFNNVPASYTSYGYKEYKCSNCGDTYKDMIPMLKSTSQTDMCVKSLLEKPLPHAANYDMMKVVLDMYHNQYGRYDDEGLYKVANELEYAKLQTSLLTSYHYIAYSLVFYGTIAPDGSPAFRVWYDSEVGAQNEQAYIYARQILNELGIDSSITQKDAIVKINDWICKHKSYDYSILDNPELVDGSIYTSFMSEKGVCANYAVEFQVLCLMSGIECHYYASSKMNHAWNKVVFSDGSHLWVDVTWNDTDNTTKYLLITDEQLLKDHSW